MKKIIVFGLCLLLLNRADAQVKSPVRWAFTTTKLDGSTYQVHLTATIEKGWHLYSQTTPDGGPVATSLVFTRNPLIEISGPAKEVGALEQKHEELFGVDVKQFSNRVDFVQTVRLKGKAKTAVNGTVEFMTCNDHECMPPQKQKFSVALK